MTTCEKCGLMRCCDRYHDLADRVAGLEVGLAHQEECGDDVEDRVARLEAIPLVAGYFNAVVRYADEVPPATSAPRTPDPDDASKCWHGLLMRSECGNCAVDAKPEPIGKRDMAEAHRRADEIFGTEKPTAPASTVPHRCEICGWTYAKELAGGCIPGNCSYRPTDPAECRRIEKRRNELGADRLPAEPPSEPPNALITLEAHLRALSRSACTPGDVSFRLAAALERRLAEVTEMRDMMAGYRDVAETQVADLTKRLADAERAIKEARAARDEAESEVSSLWELRIRTARHDASIPTGKPCFCGMCEAVRAIDKATRAPRKAKTTK